MSSPAATAAADQAAAASAHARQALHLAARLTRSPIDTTNQPPPWIRQQIALVSRSAATGNTTYCPHLGAAASLLHAAVWAPGRVVCTGCVPTLMPDHSEDMTCDRCRTTALVLNPGIVAAGPLILGYGLCDPCLTTTRKETR